REKLGLCRSALSPLVRISLPGQQLWPCSGLLASDCAGRGKSTRTLRCARPPGQPLLLPHQAVAQKGTAMSDLVAVPTASADHSSPSYASKSVAIPSSASSAGAAQPLVIGKVASPPQREATSDLFHFWVPSDRLV